MVVQQTLVRHHVKAFHGPVYILYGTRSLHE